MNLELHDRFESIVCVWGQFDWKSPKEPKSSLLLLQKCNVQFCKKVRTKNINYNMAHIEWSDRPRQRMRGGHKDWAIYMLRALTRNTSTTLTCQSNCKICWLGPLLCKGGKIHSPLLLLFLVKKTQQTPTIQYNTSINHHQLTKRFLDIPGNTRRNS